MTDIQNAIPLTPVVFHILLALANGERHGYEIMKIVKRDSNDSIKIGNGTLYGSLKRMLADELIEDVGDRTDESETRRRYYKLTDLGRQLLNAEIQRYNHTVRVIQGYQLIPSLQARGQAA